ncbi:MAP kinase kinase Wis1, partial [Linderina macrospora]
MPRPKPNLNLSQMGFSIGTPSNTPPPAQQASGLAGSTNGSVNGSSGVVRPSLSARGKKKGPGQLGMTTHSPFAAYSSVVDPTGNLNFEGKAVIGATGVNFSSGKNYAISMANMDVLEVLGRGQYGVVHKVFHTKTNVVMALKEIRLELNPRALRQIIMELEVLHKARSSYIVDFYGAFFIESSVYYCMEYMDYGSLDRLYPAGAPEGVLAKITLSVVKGLQFLKDQLNIIHRDVKPTNILVNKKGEVKLCDFGVSGELNQSLARTHVGCQSYMAPERITGTGGPNGYTIQSDVWSLGLTIIETAIGGYPYGTNGFDGIFAQINAIVHGDPPALPSDR